MDHPILFKRGDTKTDLRYIFMFSAGQRLIASKINVFVYIIYVCTVYIYYLYINTHASTYIFKKNMLCLYIKYNYI